MQVAYAFENDEQIDEEIARLEKATAYSHNSDDHPFQPSDHNPNKCKHCEWLNPEGTKNPDCGHTDYEHAVNILRQLRQLKAGEVPDSVGAVYVFVNI